MYHNVDIALGSFNMKHENLKVNSLFLECYIEHDLGEELERVIGGDMILLFSSLANQHQAVSGSTSGSIRRVCSCQFSTTPPGYQSFLISSDCGLQA